VPPVAPMAPMAPMAQMAPMHMMTVMTPVMHMPTSMQMTCGQPQMLAPMPQVSQPAHAVGEQPAANRGPASQPRKVRHNATERRRVQKLKYAYVELDGALRSRPDLVSIATASSADPTFRKRGREGEDESGDGLVNGARRMPVGPSQMPSHLQILQDSAETVRGLFELVDVLAKEIDRISQVPEMGLKLIKKTQGLAESKAIMEQARSAPDAAEADGNDDGDGTEAGGDDE